MTKRPFFHHYLLIFIQLLICFSIAGCRKEIVQPAPELNILSAKATALTSYEVKVNVKLGKGLVVKNAEVVFTDITVSADSAIVIPLTLTGQKEQTVVVHMTTSRLNHDYLVRAKLRTDSYEYSSAQAIIRSIKNNFRAQILKYGTYADPLLQFARYVNKGDQFIVLLEYQNSFVPVSFLVKLNQSLLLATTTTWEPDLAYIRCTVPADISPGTYEIDLYVDGILLVVEDKITVLKGAWSVIDTTYNGPKNTDHSCFLFGDDLYMVGGHHPVATFGSSLPVWKFNFISKQWQQKKDFVPGEAVIYSDEQAPYNLQYNNEGYMLFRHKNVAQLWKYKPDQDAWNLVTTYPGLGLSRITCFMIGHRLYAGGGDQVYQDFWTYDLLSDTWTQLKDAPLTLSTHHNAALVNNDIAFVFEYSRKLWKYDPVVDLWTEKAPFVQPRRTVSTMVSYGNSLYLLGGTYYEYPYTELQDCWEYSIASDTWQLNSFMPERFSYGLSFVYNGHIVAGMGYVRNLNEVDRQVLYQFIP